MQWWRRDCVTIFVQAVLAGLRNALFNWSAQKVKFLLWYPAQCGDETKFLEDALGNKIESRELTPDYYASTVTQDQLNKTGG